MIIVVMVFGLVLLFFVSGVGVVSCFGLGVVIVFGMLVGIFFILFVLFIVYILLVCNYVEVDKSLCSW